MCILGMLLDFSILSRTFRKKSKAISCNESLNQVKQKKLMDMLVRF